MNNSQILKNNLIRAFFFLFILGKNDINNKIEYLDYVILAIMETNREHFSFQYIDNF